jgi:hypothetical protein
MREDIEEMRTWRLIKPRADKVILAASLSIDNTFEL